MNNSQIITKHGHTLSDMSSLLQKAIRRNKVDEALYAAFEMMLCNDVYMWVRILTTSAEDCFDPVTSQVWDNLKEYYSSMRLNFIEDSISMLCSARKNRDADYFICNIMNSRDYVALDYTCSIPEEYLPYKTKNGHSIIECSDVLFDSIVKGDYAKAGYCGNELYVRYPKVFWKVLMAQAENIDNPNFGDEIFSLSQADAWQRQDKHATPILASKALLMLLKVSLYGTDIFVKMPYESASMNSVIEELVPFTVPDYVYDVHTQRGKEQGKTVSDFIIAEQNALTPYIKGDFEGGSWDYFMKSLKVGFYDKDHITPKPDAKLMKLLDDDAMLTFFYNRYRR